MYSMNYSYCCCWVTSVVPDSVQPHRRQPTRLPCPWDSPGKNTGVGCHFLLQCMKVKSESEVAQSCPTLATPWTAAYQAPSSMGFSRRKYWSGLPLPSPPTPLGYHKIPNWALWAIQQLPLASYFTHGSVNICQCYSLKSSFSGLCHEGKVVFEKGEQVIE